LVAVALDALQVPGGRRSVVTKIGRSAARRPTARRRVTSRRRLIARRRVLVSGALPGGTGLPRGPRLAARARLAARPRWAPKRRLTTGPRLVARRPRIAGPRVAGSRLVPVSAGCGLGARKAHRPCEEKGQRGGCNSDRDTLHHSAPVCLMPCSLEEMAQGVRRHTRRGLRANVACSPVCRPQSFELRRPAIR